MAASPEFALGPRRPSAAGPARLLPTCPPPAEERRQGDEPDLYRVALEASALALGLLPAGRAPGQPSGQRTARGQLVRASVSVVLRIAQAERTPSRAEQRNLYTVARASAAECTAIIHLVQRWGLASGEDCRRVRNVYLGVAQMLTSQVSSCG